MAEKSLPKTMICPCCGNTRETASTVCISCGARQVGEPLSPPDILLPKLGLSMISIGCAILIVVTFLVAWIFSNDMKVGRVLMVYALGDGTKLTQSLLQADPKLPYYRIFTYDAYKLAFMLSAGLIPLSLFGIWISRRARALASANPLEFGGLRTARVSTALCAGLLIIFSVVTATSIPGAIERSRQKHLAATRAMMYEIHLQALQKFHREYGSYPQELVDISRVNAEASPQEDYWENKFNYSPISVIASKGASISFSNYKLVSAGPDGKFGTPDDITMVDGVIVENQNDDDLPTTLLNPEKPGR